MVTKPKKFHQLLQLSESKVSSAAGIALDPIEYKIKPIQTNVPCKKIMLHYNLLKENMIIIKIILMQQ